MINNGRNCSAGRGRCLLFFSENSLGNRQKYLKNPDSVPIRRVRHKIFPEYTKCTKMFEIVKMSRK
ncbi:hypothetical protein B5F07_20540 [Lachnoclostridium sp. An169]|nr:hypothetical protein B5F07_20540 [Lachnoclostridium sp. An169]